MQRVHPLHSLAIRISQPTLPPSHWLNIIIYTQVQFLICPLSHFQVAQGYHPLTSPFRSLTTHIHFTMRFQLQRRLPYGSALLLTGSHPSLAAWDPAKALVCKWTSGDVWTTHIPNLCLPARFEFKYIIRAKSGHLEWESCPNHALVIPPHALLDSTIDITWGKSKEHVAPRSINGAASPPPTPSGNILDTSEALALAAENVSNGQLDPIVNITFRHKLPLAAGERLYVGGSLPKLGAWNKMNAPRMELVSGKSYQLNIAVPLSADVFEYKYFIRDRGDGRRWEDGENRAGRVEEDLVLEDRWGKIRVDFSIYYPGHHHQVMHITGDPPQIGAWYKPGPTRMKLGPVEKLETDVMGRKWFLRTWMDPGQTSFSYRYIFIDDSSGQELWEREPNRKAEISEGKPIYNCAIVQKDVNFVSAMMFDQVPPNMFIGPYPQTAADIDAMAKGGVTAVFNVQTDEDFKHRGIQWKKLMVRYKHHGIKAIRYPIRDFDRDSLRSHLHGATHALDKLLKEGRQVYIHCTAGMGRAPACAVSYLCWVKGMKLEQAVAHVKKHRTVAVPNVPVLEAALKQAY